MKLEVDVKRCEGHGLCVKAAPKVLHHNEDAEVVVDVAVLTGEALEQAREAVRLCPVAALRLVEIK